MASSPMSCTGKAKEPTSCGGLGGGRKDLLGLQTVFLSLEEGLCL
jgi:hypothetical protein